MTVRMLVAAALLVSTVSCTSSEPRGSSAPSRTPSSPSATDGSPISQQQRFAGAWLDATAGALGETGDWTNKVEVADLDGDGDVDLLFANGGDYDTPGTPVASRVFLNAGDGTFKDATRSVFGRTKALARVIKVADFNGDTYPDIVLGTTFETQSRLFLGDESGWTDVTQENLPAARFSSSLFFRLDQPDSVTVETV